MKSFFPLFVFLFLSSFFAESTMAECKVWVNGYVKKNGTVVKGHYRTCPDGDKNNNYGKPEYRGQPPRERDQDGDGLPNYRDRDDNNNGLSDNTDHALGKIYREKDPRRARIPRYDQYKRYDEYPVVKGPLGTIVIFLPRTLVRTTSVQWNVWGECVEYSRQGYQIGKVDRNQCREELGSSFQWNVWGECFEKTPEGYNIGKVDSNYCRAYVGRYFEWTVWGECDEKTPEGYFIRKLENRDACRITQGSKYEFDMWGDCYEKTLQGYNIRKVQDKNYCRYENYGAVDTNPTIMQSDDYRLKAAGQIRNLEESVDSALGHHAK